MDRFLLVVLLLIVVVIVAGPVVQSLGQAATQIAEANATSNLAEANKTASLTGMAGMFMVCANGFASLVLILELMGAGVWIYLRKMIVRQNRPGLGDRAVISGRREYLPALPEPGEPISDRVLLEIIEKLGDWKK